MDFETDGAESKDLFLSRDPTTAFRLVLGNTGCPLAADAWTIPFLLSAKLMKNLSQLQGARAPSSP